MNTPSRSTTQTTTQTTATSRSHVKVWLATAMAAIAALLLGILGACASGSTEAAAPPGDEVAVFPPEQMLPDTGADIDWSGDPIIVDGRGLSIAPLTVGDAKFPTHVPLSPVADALGLAAEGLGNLHDGDTVTLDGLAGAISFVVGSGDFTLDGTVVALDGASIVQDGTLFVPISFFRDVFGVQAAYWTGGHVFIETVSDMT
jgi:hypothetical protein